MTRLADYMARQEFDTVLKRTEDFNMYKGIDSLSYGYKIEFRVESLLILGRFSEAEKLCYEALDSQKLNETRTRYIYYFLLCIYYYTNQYLKCIYLLNSGYIHDCDINSKKTKSLFKSIACVGNPELYDKMFKIPKTTFVNHVLGRRKADVKLDLNKLYDVMKDNFVNTRAYYKDLSYFRIFRCFNVGKTDFNNKPDLCNYIQVISVKDDPDTMITCYFISDPGSLTFYDITTQVFDDKKVSSESKQRSKQNIDKFRSRQEKKKN
ncbi:MAG: hypothetical protein IKX00_02030 [Bacilli bacterium]|nr:hypothetical protein [Bacilli bacterium]